MMYAREFKDLANYTNETERENQEEAKKFFEDVLLKKIKARAEEGLYDLNLIPGYSGTPGKESVALMSALFKYIKSFGFEAKMTQSVLVVNGVDIGHVWSTFYISWKNC